MVKTTRKWVILVPVVIALGAVTVMKQKKPTPLQQPPQEQARLVRTITVPSLTVTPQVIGHGTARPSESWQAVAEVTGKVVEKHPALEKGAIIEKDTLILRIDPTDYRLAIARIEADIASTRASLQELETRASNTQAALEIEREAYRLNEKELQRQRRLIAQGSVSRSDLDSQERALLAQKQSVQTQVNAINLIPSQRALLEAGLKRHQSSLDSARRDLEQTEIRLPFTGRVAEVNVELNRYVREGEQLTSIDTLAMAEVETQIPIDQFTALIHSDSTLDLTRLPRPDRIAFPVSARVRLKEGSLKATWEGRVARVSDTLDPKTRTVGVIVEVDNPYSNVQPGSRPPLVKGLFVELLLQGKAEPAQLVLPRHAVTGGQAYLVDGDNRLRRRTLDIALLQAEYVVVRGGLAEGDRVIVSDLIPAVEGMLLEPVADEASQQRLLEQVAGERRP
ncbi:MAG: efflux RND transporter periplasmic adaptor subunit [Gammaproteobacteria bacterium]|nr:efflux RND transporter periplasmic adaptor subunit [Gammaproteobacteria bacterium]